MWCVGVGVGELCLLVSGAGVAVNAGRCVCRCVHGSVCGCVFSLF